MLNLKLYTGSLCVYISHDCMYMTVEAHSITVAGSYKVT